MIYFELKEIVPYRCNMFHRTVRLYTNILYRKPDLKTLQKYLPKESVIVNEKSYVHNIDLFIPGLVSNVTIMAPNLTSKERKVVEMCIREVDMEMLPQRDIHFIDGSGNCLIKIVNKSGGILQGYEDKVYTVQIRN